MLIGNGARLFASNPMGQFGAASVGSIDRPTWIRQGARNNSLTVFAPSSGYPDGTRHPGSWCMARKGGGLAARNTVTGSGAVSSANAWAVKLAQASITGSGELTGVGAKLFQLVAALTGSGTISTANLQAFLAAVANLTGSGGVTDADLEGLGALLAAIAGEGTAATSILTGIGELDADLVVTGTGLSTANVGQAVWSAIAASNNGAGTMGEKLNDAGSGSNPWTEVIESGLTAAEVLRLIASALAGDATGLESGSPVFKSLDGAKNRIVGTYSGGNRTVTSRDGT